MLLEIGASQHLFGHALQIAEQVQDQAQEHEATQGYVLCAAVAPTPLAAEILARAIPHANPHANADESDASSDKHLNAPTVAPRECLFVESRSALTSALDQCPVPLLWDAKLCARLEAVGVHRLGQCRALPAAGFRKRYGRAALIELQRLYGDCADPRPLYVPPSGFQRRIELDEECPNSAQLEPVCAILFEELARVLVAQDRSVHQLQLRFHHGRGEGSHDAAQAPTEVRLGLRQAGRQPQRWSELLHEHLQRLALPAPVRTVELMATDFLDPGAGQMDFWQSARADQREALMERLTARLGTSALRHVRTVANHRPEAATEQYTAASCATGQTCPDSSLSLATRPIWLLATPRAVSPTQLRQISPPERLESNWWENECTRDYHRARNAQGQLVWVYRDHRDGERWYLHGLFG